MNRGTGRVGRMTKLTHSFAVARYESTLLGQRQVLRFAPTPLRGRLRRPGPDLRAVLEHFTYDGE